MKRNILIIIGVLTLGAALYSFAADHIDAPAVGSLDSGTTLEDVADYYAFESAENPDNYVFAGTFLSLTAPSATAGAQFDEDVMYEINIDTDGDFQEDLVIQSIFRDGKAIVFGPTPPATSGLNSKIENAGIRVEVALTPNGETPIVGESQGIRVFAGPREDPFFLDFFRFRDVLSGAGANAGLQNVEPPRFGDNYTTSFAEPAEAVDTFAGTNVLALVIELPKSMLQATSINSWLEAKRKL